MSVEIDWTPVNERRRTYVFADRSLIFENVVKLCVRDSGYHRLETKDGLKHIVAPGWLSVSLDMDDWNR